MIFLLVLLFGQTDVIRESGYGLEIRPVIDYDAGLVYYEEWADSLYLGIAGVQTLEEYLASVEKDLSLEEFKSRLREKAKANESEGVEGIIPDIKIQMGKERTDVKISGQDKITLGSSVSKYPNQVLYDEDAQKQNLLSGIKLEQNLNVSVKGVIARKTEVLIDHTSGSGNELTDNNKVRLTYTGDEDEIVKKIEAGDVALNLPSRQQLPAHQGLFGINTQAKLGPIDLYAVASREESKSGSKEFTGSSESYKGQSYDRDYIHRRYFYIFHEGLRSSVNIKDAKISEQFELYLAKSDNSIPQDEVTYYGSAYLYPDYPDSLGSQAEKERKFYKLKPSEDYELRPYNGVWVIELKRDLETWAVLAAACTTSTDTFGSSYKVGDTTKYNFLLVWSRDPDSTNVCWTNMLRNHYNLPGNVAVDQIKVSISRNDGGTWNPTNSEKKLYSNVLGLTEQENSNIHNLSADEARLSELIFEDEYPFTSEALGADTVHDIYWKKSGGAEIGGMYKIEYEYESLVKNYTLEPFIIANSVKVWLNGNELDSNLYKVDTTMGTVTILTKVQSTDEIKITYETKELFALDRKSLLGFRAESEVFDGVKLGGSLLYRNVGYSVEGKPTLELEPYSRTIGELDLAVERKAGFLTRWIDLLPIVSTEAESRFTLNANSSISMPNPNTHKSQSVWIEDFESTKETRSVDLEPNDWYTTSIPRDETGSSIDTAFYSRVRPKWKSEDIIDPKKEIWGQETSYQEGTLPQTSPSLKVTWTPEGESYWAGIIGSTYGRLPLDITEAENLEIIMKTNTTNGRIHFDFGSVIAEDQLRLNADKAIVGLGVWNKEDLDDNNELNAGEDRGLDGVTGDDDSTDVAGDDGNDDFNSSTNPNGTEGNGQLDNEDLLRDGFVRDQDDYYEFDFDLSDTTFFDEHVDSLGENGWIKVSIPLGDTTLYYSVGSPNKYSISMFRMWLDGMTTSANIQIYSWDFVGNKWKYPLTFSTDSSAVDSATEKVFIDVIGTETGDYGGPFPPGKTSSGEEQQENSLRMTYENIEPLHGAKASRWDYSTQDFRGYQRIKIYVNDKSSNDMVFYLRMGTDSTNYYEIRNRIADGEIPSSTQDAGWREFTFELEGLAKLKKDNYTTLRYDASKPVIISEEDPNLRVRGVPSFAMIKYFDMGIVNESTGATVSGEVWFDDIRLEGPYREIGTKLSADGKLVFADVGSIAGSYSRNDGKFIDFISEPGPRTSGETHNAGVSGNLNLEKFGPDRLGFKLPVNYGYSLSRSLPRYSGEITDYILADEELELRRERSDSKTLSFSVSHPQSKSKLLKYTLDAIKGGANYRISGSESNAGLARDTSFVQNYDISYSVNPNLSFTVFKKEKISYFPSSINLSANFDKTNSISYYRNAVLPIIVDGETLQDTTWEDLPSRNSSLTMNASTAYSPVKYLPFSASFRETRALQEDVWIDELLNQDFYSRGLGLSSGIKNINLSSFGRPSVDVSSSFSEDKSETISDNLNDEYSEDSTNVLFPEVRTLANSGKATFSWQGFDLKGIFASAKQKTEKKLKELESESPPPDSTLPQSLEQDSIPQDTLAADSSGSDTVPQPQIAQPSYQQQRYQKAVKFFKTLEDVTKFLQPVGAEASFGRNSSYGYYVGDFGWQDNWKYVVGVEDSLPVVAPDSTHPYDDDAITSMGSPPYSLGWNQSYKASSGISVAGILINGNVGYTFNENTQAFSYKNNYSKSVTLPSVTVTYTKLGDLLKKVASSSQLRSSFSRILTEQGVMDTVPTDTVSETRYDTTTGSYVTVITYTDSMYRPVPNVKSTQYNFAPLISWSTAWKGRVSSDISLNYATSVNISNYGKADSVHSESVTKGISGSLGYTFNKPSGFKIPFLKHVKFKNDLSLTGTASYSETMTRSNLRTDTLTGEWLELKNTTTTGNIHAQYTFSEAFDGGLDFTVSNYKDSDRPTNDHTDVKLDVFVIFKF